MCAAKHGFAVVCLGVLLLGASLAVAQAAASGNDQAAAISVPRLVRFSGVVKEAQGNPRGGVTGITFALYKGQAGGAALWLETQNVTLDVQGRYTVLLGINSAEGMPLDVFSDNDARWLGVQPEGLPEHRVLLVSVPYALKAADAETLGGKPASSFVLAAPPTASDSTGTGQTGTNAVGTSGPSPAAAITGSGSNNTVAKFDSSGTNIVSSSISDNGTVVSTSEPVGIGTTTPGAQLDVQVNTTTGQNALNSTVTLSNTSANNCPPTCIISAMNLQFSDSSQNTNFSKQPLRIAYLRQPGATGGVQVFDTVFTTSSFIHSNAPYPLRGANIEGPNVDAGQTLQTFYGAFFDQPNATGTTGTVNNYYGAYFRTLTGAPGKINNGFALVTEPGAGNVGIGTIAPTQQLEVGGNLKISGNGNALIFPDGTTQTTASVGGGGTITGVTAGAGLSGGGTSGNVPISVASGGITNAMLASNSVTNTDIADGTLTPAKTAGTAAIVTGSNAFSAPQTINAAPSAGGVALGVGATTGTGGVIGLLASSNDPAGIGAVITNTASASSPGRAYILDVLDSAGNHGMRINSNGLEMNVPIVARIQNDATGTMLNTLVRYTNTNTVATIPTSAAFNTGAIGVVVADAGTSGKATVAFTGLANCIFDNTTPTTLGDYVVPSITVASSTPIAGDCHDYGNASGLPRYPLAGVQIVGRVATTNASGTCPPTCQGTPAQVYLYSYETRAIGQISSFSWCAAGCTFPSQTAAISPTTLFTPLVPGLFRVNVYMTATAGTTCSPQPCISSKLNFEDENGVESLSFLQIFQVKAFIQQSILVRSIGGQPITYSTTYGTTDFTYEAFVTIERLM